MTLYRPRGETIEAWQVGSGESPEWARQYCDFVLLRPGDWLVKGSLGIEFVPSWRFKAIYEPVDGDLGSGAAEVAGDGQTAAGGGLNDVLLASWQPISTAPRDGTEVLLAVPAYGRGPERVVSFGWWEDGAWRDAGYENELYSPTHWTPVPAPPQLDMTEGTT